LVALVSTASAGAHWLASSGGGNSIATAPPMPLGTEVSSGALRTRKLNNLPWASEYWKVAMAPGNRLVLDYGATNQLGVGVCVLSPDVTDYTEQNAQCLASAMTGDKTELRFVAPVAGDFTVRFAVIVCACTDPLSYSFNARVVSATTMILRTPRTVRHGTTLQVKGVVTGGARGSVAIRLPRPSNRRKIAALGPGGRFSTSFKLRYPGQYTLAATFYGDPAHAQSSKTVRVTAKWAPVEAAEVRRWAGTVDSELR
jgi:hypothetical protein